MANVFERSFWIIPLQMIEQHWNGPWVGLWLFV